MKHIFKVFVFISLMFTLSGCIDKGETIKVLNGTEENLPPELKGLKVYLVGTSNGGSVKVAFLNGEINSTTYLVGKVECTTIILNQNTKKQRVINAKQIISENDSIIVIRK